MAYKLTPHLPPNKSDELAEQEGDGTHKTAMPFAQIRATSLTLAKRTYTYVLARTSINMYVQQDS